NVMASPTVHVPLTELHEPELFWNVMKTFRPATIVGHPDGGGDGVLTTRVVHVATAPPRLLGNCAEIDAAPAEMPLTSNIAEVCPAAIDTSVGTAATAVFEEVRAIAVGVSCVIPMDTIAIAFAPVPISVAGQVSEIVTRGEVVVGRATSTATSVD